MAYIWRDWGYISKSMIEQRNIAQNLRCVEIYALDGQYCVIPIFVDFEITATYDMEFPAGDENNVKRATAREVPELPALTLCFWIRLPRGYTKKSFLMYPMIEYRGGGSESLYIGLVGEETEPKLDLIFNGGGKQ